MASSTHLALLRGINVGGRNTLRMADLAAAFEAAGCREVRTYLQSGNVLFQAPAKAVPGVSAAVASILAERHGVVSPVIARPAAELESVVAALPFRGRQADPASLHVAFLSAKPSPAGVETLDPDRSPGDAFAVRGREVYLHLPNGVAKTKLTNAYFDKTLGTVSTVRNWRTVLRLAEMCGVG